MSERALFEDSVDAALQSSNFLGVFSFRALVGKIVFI